MRLTSVSIEWFQSVRLLEHLRIGSPTSLSGHNDAGAFSVGLDVVEHILELGVWAHVDVR